MKYNKAKKIIEPETYLTDPKSLLYRGKPPVFNMEIFEDIGRATLIAILEMEDDNPISRVSKSIYKDVKSMRLEISIQNNINVAQAKKMKEEMLRKRLEIEEKRKRGIQMQRPVRRTVLTPGAENRINKLHRGMS